MLFFSWGRGRIEGLLHPFQRGEEIIPLPRVQTKPEGHKHGHPRVKNHQRRERSPRGDFLARGWPCLCPEGGALQPEGVELFTSPSCKEMH